MCCETKYLKFYIIFYLFSTRSFSSHGVFSSTFIGVGNEHRRKDIIQERKKVASSFFLLLKSVYKYTCYRSILSERERMYVCPRFANAWVCVLRCVEFIIRKGEH